MRCSELAFRRCEKYLNDLVGQALPPASRLLSDSFAASSDRLIRRWAVGWVSAGERVLGGHHDLEIAAGRCGGTDIGLAQPDGVEKVPQFGLVSHSVAAGKPEPAALEFRRLKALPQTGRANSGNGPSPEVGLEGIQID
jgi:hypothetical protein